MLAQHLMERPIRLTAVLTHPTQYCAPWFRHISAHCPAIDLTVLYATRPGAEQQGVGFGEAFEWDVSLTEGYRCRVLRPARSGESVHHERFWSLNVGQIAPAIRDSRPDVALVPGWHSVTLLRALWACRRARIPVLYRGDTHLGNTPAGWRRMPWTMRTWLFLRLFDAYLSVGRRAHEYLRRFGASASLIFDAPHCVDNAFFAARAASHRTPDGRADARTSLGLERHDFVIVFVGKLEPEKRPLDLMPAMARLGPGASLLMVGAGELEQQCRAEARRLGVRVSWAGFLNQSALGRAYAAADCLVLPSGSETWGLVVNEALATGLPCVVSDRVGCASDLVTPGETGEVFPAGDVVALADAVRRVRERSSAGRDWAVACRERAARYSLERATSGLLAACRAVTTREPSPASVAGERRAAPRVVACCGGMVIVGGLERMTFEVLRVLRDRGAVVHCIVNSWENHRIVALAGEIGASWSTGYYWYRFDRHARNPLRWIQFGWDVLRTSIGLWRDARRFRATHVLVPEFESALRNAPALGLLRMMRIPVVLRVANHPAPGRFYRWTWGRVLPLLVTRFVANSRFSAERLRAAGVPAGMTITIRNTVASRTGSGEGDADVVRLVRARRTVLSVGQIAPFKGTHVVVEAMVRLLEAGEDVQAVIVGPLPVWPADRVEYVRALEQRVVAAGVQDRIRFVGERLNVLEIMRAAYVLAAPILQEETFGNVALEAKSVGLPVVAFATGGIPELVEHGVTGYLCAAMTVEALLEGLRFFLDDPARRDKAGAAGLAAVAQPDGELGRATFATRWGSLFEDLSR